MRIGKFYVSVMHMEDADGLHDFYSSLEDMFFRPFKIEYIKSECRFICIGTSPLFRNLSEYELTPEYLVEIYPGAHPGIDEIK